MPANVQIRPAGPADRDVWLRLRAELWPHHPPSDLAREVQSYLEGGGLWKLGTQSLTFRAYVAEDPDRRIVGFVEASLRSWAEKCRTSPVGYLEGWYVVPDRRRQAIGGALVQAAEAWARSNGAREMASDAHAENDLSERCHAALGYEVVGRLIHFRRTL